MPPSLSFLFFFFVMFNVITSSDIFRLLRKFMEEFLQFIASAEGLLMSPHIAEGASDQWTLYLTCDLSTSQSPHLLISSSLGGFRISTYEMGGRKHSNHSSMKEPFLKININCIKKSHNYNTYISQ